MEPTEAWFEAQVIAALDDLPEEFRGRLTNLEIVVQARPTPEQRRVVGLQPWQTLYGLYQGIPLPARSVGYNLVAPDRITLFTAPLLRDFPAEQRLRAQIRRTVRHEIAHFFGIGDDRLRELDAY